MTHPKFTLLTTLAASTVLFAGCTTTSKVGNSASGGNTNVADTNVTANTNLAVANTNSTNTVMVTNDSSNENTNVDQGSVDTSDWQTYANTTLGFSLQYPTGWKFEEGQEYAATHGPIIINGEVSTGYTAVFSDNQQLRVGISAGGTYLDGLSISDVLKSVACDKDELDVSCQEITNTFGTKYIRTISKDLGGDALYVRVPTGLYTIVFALSFSSDLYAPENVDSIKIFDSILSTVQLTK